MEERAFTVRLAGVDLAVVALGTPEPCPLVVVHGGPDWDHSYLRAPLDRLSTRRQVVLFDLRGCGASSRGLAAAAYQPQEAVQDIVGLLDVLNVARADVLGFSYGGQLVIRLLSLHPDRVGRLVLASTTAYGTNGQQQMADAGEGRVQPGVVAGILADPDLTAQEQTEHLAHATAALDIWDLTRLTEYRRLLERINFSGEWMRGWQAGTLRQALPADAEGIIARHDRATLILHGAHDMRFPVSHALALADSGAVGQIVVLDEAGHMAQYEQPDAWIAAIDEFLQ